MSDETLPTIADRLRVLREDETAKLLSIHVQTLRRYRRDGTGPSFIRIGAKLFGYRVGDVETWQEQRRAA